MNPGWESLCQLYLFTQSQNRTERKEVVTAPGRDPTTEEEGLLLNKYKAAEHLKQTFPGRERPCCSADQYLISIIEPMKQRRRTETPRVLRYLFNIVHFGLWSNSLGKQWEGERFMLPVSLANSFVSQSTFLIEFPSFIKIITQSLKEERPRQENSCNLIRNSFSCSAEAAPQKEEEVLLNQHQMEIYRLENTDSK